MAYKRRHTPEHIGQLMAQAAAASGADPLLLLATAYVESGLNNLAVGDGGTSFGLFQHHIGGAGGSAKETAEKYLDPAESVSERARAFAGAKTGADAANIQRPANAAAYAKKVDATLLQIKKAVSTASAGGSGKKNSPLRQEIKTIAVKQFGLKHTSGDRAQKYTSDGNVSDHWEGQVDSWADDYSGAMANMRGFERYLNTRSDLKQVLGPQSRPKDHSDHVHVAGYSRSSLSTVAFIPPSVSGQCGGVPSVISKALKGMSGAASNAVSGAAEAVSGAAGEIVDQAGKLLFKLLLIAAGLVLIVFGVIRLSGSASGAIIASGGGDSIA